jgi:ligand-binding sensor domain-containing protein
MKMRTARHQSFSPTLVLMGLAAGTFAMPAQGGDTFPLNPPLNIVKPSNTGIPGEEVRVMTVDSQGNLWIAGRWPFWSECAIAMLPPEEQAFVPQPGGGFDTGKWQVWSNTDHPIPSPYINSLRITSDGVVWIGSDGGLTRFDRNASTPEQMWKTWNSSNAPLIVNGIQSISVDSEGDLWMVNRVVNTLAGGVFEFDRQGETWTNHPVQGGNFDFAAVGLSVGGDGNVYITHEFASGFSRKSSSGAGNWIYQPGGTSFSGVSRDSQGNLWFGGGIGGLPGLWKWNGSTFQNWPNLDVTGLGYGLDGTLYVATWYGPVYKMVNGTTPEFLVDAQGLPRSVIQRPNGDFFINNYGSTMALGRVRQYDSHGTLLRRMNTYNCGLPDYWITTISKDSSGNTWFGSSEGGISRMLGSDPTVPTRWRNFGDHNDWAEQYPWSGSEPMYSMYEDDQGFTWLGGNGIGKLDQKSGDIVGFWNYANSNVGSTSIMKFVKDGNGDIWAATDMWGIFKYRPDINDWEQKLFGASQAVNAIAGMIVDTDGNMWVATPSMLHFFNGTNWYAISEHHGAPMQWLTCLAADPNGGIWVGADNGLFKYHNGKWTHYNTSNSPLPVNHVVSMDIRPDGVMGINVSDYLVNPPNTAIVLFDGNSGWQIYTAATHGFPHWQFEAVGFDADGDLWVSTLSEGVTEVVLHQQNSPGDTNGDGSVNVDDLLVVINGWGVCSAPPATCQGDLNGNGIVDVDDLLMVIDNWT